MKKIIWKKGLATVFAAALFIGMTATEAAEGGQNMEIVKTRAELESAKKYPVGATNDAYAKYFIGQSYLADVSGSLAGFNVTFEPGCRNNWHIHHGATQILIGTGGIGWYQEWGKAPQTIKEGTVIAIPPEVKHWHGASVNSWFAHISMTIPQPGQKEQNEWLEPVADEDYGKLPKA